MASQDVEASPDQDFSAAETDARQEGRRRSIAEEASLITFADLGIWGYSPWPVSAVKNVDAPGARKLKHVRFFWLLLLFVAYTYTEYCMVIDEDLTSGVRQGLVDEFFPDAGKTGERLAGGEIVPGLGERMHSDDVASTLTWYSAFCKNKAATDVHIMDSWRCRMTQVIIGKSHPPRWDAFHNRGLPDDASEDVKTRERVNVYTRHKQYDQKDVDEPIAAISKICNPRFLAWHMGRGDDPGLSEVNGAKYSQEQAPFGDTEAFSENVLKSMGVRKNLNKSYDEFNVLDHYQLFAGLSDYLGEHLHLPAKEPEGEAGEEPAGETSQLELKLKEHVQTLKKKIKARPPVSSMIQLQSNIWRLRGILGGSRKRQLGRPLGASPPVADHAGKQHHERMRSGQTQAHELDIAPDPAKPRAEFPGPSYASVLPGGFLQRTNASVSSFREPEVAPHGISPSRVEYHPGAKAGGEDENETAPLGDEALTDDKYGTGCFQRMDIVGMLMDEFIQRDKDNSGNLDKDEATALISDIFQEKDKTKRAALYAELDQDQDTSISALEYLKFATAHNEELKFSVRGYLSEECRNHHWGLVSLCKPEAIEATFRVQKVVRAEGGWQKLGSYLDLVIRFDVIGHRKNSGWYQASLDIDSGNPPGAKGWNGYMAAIVTLALFVVMILCEFVITVLSWPFTCIQLFHFGSSEDCTGGAADRSVRHAWEALCKIFKAFFDGRKARTHFMSHEFLMLELLTGLAFVLTVRCSIEDSFSPKIVPIGRQDVGKPCIDAYLADGLAFGKAMLEGGNEEAQKRGISPYVYMTKCMKFDNAFDEFCEVLFELVFQNNYHAWVLALISMRLLQCFEFSKSTSWLPHTLKLAFSKLANFIMMFTVVVGAFAIVMYISFGRLYTQFDSIPKACISLLLYTFGMTDRAEQDIHPYIENSGTKIVIILLLYTITVVTIGLNFFTTIIMDSYASACDPDYDETELEAEALASLAWLGHYLSIPREVFLGPEDVREKLTKRSSRPSLLQRLSGSAAPSPPAGGAFD